MITCVGPKDKKYYSQLDQTVYNVTSCSTDFCKELSPMLLGPCELYKGFKAKRLENAWQYSKVYAEHIDSDGMPTMEYFKWAYLGWNNNWGVRYPMGRGAKPKYSLWEDDMLDYISARKKIYMPLYIESARKTDAYKRLKLKHLNGEDLILWDYDGRITNETMDQIIHNPDKPLGHSFVIRYMLENNI